MRDSTKYLHDLNAYRALDAINRQMETAVSVARPARTARGTLAIESRMIDGDYILTTIDEVR